MNTTHRLFGVGLIGATVLGSVAAGVVTAAPASAATIKPVEVTADVTRGFEIVNKTKHTWTLSGVDYPGIRDDYPQVQTTIAPGQSLHYEKVYYFAQYHKTNLQFTYTEDLGGGASRISTFEVQIVVDAWSAPNIFTDADSFFTVDKHGLMSASTVDLLEKDYSTVTVPAEDAQRQAELLNKTCISGLASCTFTPTSKEEAPPQSRVVAGGANNTSEVRTGTFTTKTAATTTSSVETSGSAKLAINGIVELGLQNKYNKSWSTTREETKTQDYKIKPYHNYNMSSRVLMDRVTGDFTVKLGKTTWNLSNVSFDVPNPDADILYDASERPLTEQEKANLPKVIEIKPAG